MARRNEYLEHLATVPMLQACTKKELQTIARRAEDMHFRPGKVLTTEGKFGREFFVIAEGTAKVARKGRRIATLGPGDFFGELALLDRRQPRNATVTAETDLECLVLEQSQFMGLLDDVPSVAIKLLKGLARRVHELDRTSKI